MGNDDSNAEIKKKLALVRPSVTQLHWQETEFYAFFHFGTNTFMNLEWGDGTASPKMFNPTDLDCEQWVRTIKAAGMKGAIITAKHHDGFCLWPSKFTDYSVASSPWENGQGDVVGKLAEACHKYGLKFGFYLSPWDRHDWRYGTAEYNTYYRAQLTELLTNYGEIFSVWFDGACGEGPNGKRQKYDWYSYQQLIRQLQPGAAISISGPDVRWIGNEAGHTRAQEWSVVPKYLYDEDLVREQSQSKDDGEFRNNFDATEDDLGSFERVKNGEVIWWPAEVDVSIRPGWFYHQLEDAQVKSVAELLDIYYHAIGGNASLILNIPPNPSGKLADADVKVLTELGEHVKGYAAHNLVVADTTIIADTELSADFSAENLRQSADNYFWAANITQTSGKIIFTWPQPVTFNMVELAEPIAYGQRVEKFTLATEDEIFSGQTIGYKKIYQLARPITTKQLTVTIEQARGYPMLSFVGVYFYELTFPK